MKSPRIVFSSLVDGWTPDLVILDDRTPFALLFKM